MWGKLQLARDFSPATSKEKRTKVRRELKLTPQRGVTLIEMLLVVALIGIMVGVTFPSVSAGVDTLRLTSSTDSVASFLNGALNRAERRQQVMEITISRDKNNLTLRSAQPGFTRELTFPVGVSISKILPEQPQQQPDERHIFLFPGGTVPRIGLELTNKRGTRRIVRVDPMTGVPEIEIPQTAEKS
jgi:prepilin-type N-terminal cleavage/methylation domain-containing protein